MIMAYFERNGCVQRNLYLNASYQRDIVWFFSSSCYLRGRHWPECVGRVKRTFGFTGTIDVLHGAVVRRPILYYTVHDLGTTD